ncbi:MAG: heat-inducible transcriptional repressor HrcA [Candidatus Zixiibacteriota bacterium]
MAELVVAFENLTDRERQVLANLIDYYIATAGPVGSRAIAHKYRMGLSSATIRNTLQDLEDLGLVEQPHTSAGRIPTDSGYRVYVDSILRPEPLSDDEKTIIRRRLVRDGRGIREILGQTAKILSDITHQLGLTVAPRFEVGILKDIRLIPVADDRLMVVVVMHSGLARSLILEVETSLADESIAEVELVLNERLRGLTLSDIRDTISARLADVSGHGRVIKIVIDSKDQIWSEDRSEDLIFSGTDNLAAMPEFADRERLKAMLKVVEEGRVLSDFLSQAQGEGLVITIGREHAIDEIINCSLVTATYKVGEISGAVGIIGPTRLPYSKAVSIVEYAARSISDLLAGMDRQKDQQRNG